MQRFVHHEDLEWTELGGGQRRKICAWNDEQMLVRVGFDDGAVGADHSHPHTQMSYVLSGSFRYTVEEESTVLNTGDSIVVPGGLVHGTVCLEKGVLLVVFTPKREDFLKA